MRAVFGSNRRLIALGTSSCTIDNCAPLPLASPGRPSPNRMAAPTPFHSSSMTIPIPTSSRRMIVAQAAGVDINTGADISVLTFNGTIPGPEFRLKVGDTVIVHFRNEIAHPTGIHWHGIELHNAHDGTPLTQNHGGTR